MGMQSLVFQSKIGHGTVIEPGCTIISVHIQPNRYVKAGSVVTDQATADKLPAIDDKYKFQYINKAVVHVNTELAKTYRKLYGF